VLPGVGIVAALVVLHEGGHFLAAKLCGIDVPIFSIGFGRRLIGIQIGGTDYRISAIPFGGYVGWGAGGTYGWLDAEEDEADDPAGGVVRKGRGFAHLMTELPYERTILGVCGVAAIERALQLTIEHTRERRAFGQALIEMQNTRFVLAELKTEIQIGRTFVDRCLQLMAEGRLDAQEATMAKYWCSDLQCKVIDECVQLHGGYGYMWEYPVARAWADARVQRIYGGTNEIMKEVIARSMGLGGR
jgi:hypothetical protein